MKPNNITRLLLVITLTAILQQFANAQIVYEDVNPDVTSSGTYNLDVNNNGTVDFVIQHRSRMESKGILLIRKFIVVK